VKKGLLFGGEFEIRQPFDPLKLKFSFTNADGWYICNGVQYDGEDIDNNDYSTTGKWGENKWIIIGDEEVYEGVYRDGDLEFEDEDNEFEVELEEDEVVEENTLSEWFSVDVKPIHKGEYEIELESTTWPFPSTTPCYMVWPHMERFRW
jgi:hypothetical protein